jgi:hypothetical protein
MSFSLIGNLAIVALKTFNTERQLYFKNKIIKLKKDFITESEKPFDQIDMNKKGQLEREMELLGQEIIKESNGD